MSTFPRPLDRDDFEIAVICALPVEARAVEALFDEFWEEADYGRARGDTNVYTLGRIGRYNVVLAYMPGMGKANAAAVATCFRFSFPGIKLGFVVGICGGVPMGSGTGTEIVLGDVIISTGIVQYDFGRKYEKKFIRKDTLESNLGRPIPELRSFLAKLEGNRSRQRLLENILCNLALLSDKQGFENVRYPGADEDILFESIYRHKHHDLLTCTVCAKCMGREDEVCAKAYELSCAELKCDKKKQLTRPRLVQAREGHTVFGESHAMARQNIGLVTPFIHFGLIASGDTVMKSGEDRDRIAAEEGVFGFEMEGAGVWDNFPCVVIKGVCDYADAHKNKKWQSYAALTAAACMKAFLNEWVSWDKSSRMSPLSSSQGNRIMSNEIVVAEKVHFYPKATVSACLRTLSYSSIDDRKNNIALAHQNTYNWLFDTTTFQKWWRQDDLLGHNGVLWIKGKPGTGKSTMMKHILLYCQENFIGTIVAHFFSARGNKLEKTMFGMIRSLLYQLLESDSVMCELFVQKYLDKEKKHGTQWEWTAGELQNFLLLESKRGQIKPLLLIIDALDECDDSEVPKVVDFLEELSISAVGAKIDIYICLSSRHYPTIDMNTRAELKVDDQEQHDQDIIIYVQNKLKARDKAIEEELLRKAERVFLWVVLVVEMLNQAFYRGKTKAMQKKLQEVPSDLDGIFFDILQRDSPDKEATLLMFQWMLFAIRLLSPEELYFAVRAGIEPEELGPWDPQKETHEDIERYITSTSKGLIEIRTGDKRTVQFIHESVNDFLLRNKRLQTLQPALQQHPVGSSHDRLVSCCMAYIGMGDLDPYATLERVPKSKVFDSKHLASIKTFFKRFPFTEYAAKYVLDHAEMAEAGHISQRAYLQRLKSGDFQRLREFHDVFLDVEWRYTNDLIYAASLKGLYEISEVILQDNLCIINTQAGFYNTALQAALASGKVEMVELLLEKGADVNLQGGEYGTALQAASADGTMEMVELLLEKGADVNLQGGHHGTALQAASANGTMEMVELLLEKGADVNLQGGHHGTALQAASANGTMEMVELLLEKGADVNLQGGEYGTALQAASACGESEIAKLLIKEGADVNLQGGYYGTALQAASVCGESEIPKLLIKEGADVNLQGGYHGTALQAASRFGRRKMVELLIEKGADVNLQGGEYGTALQAASACGESEIAKLLIKEGADVNLQGGHHGTALQAASACGESEIAKLLIKEGADVNLQGGYYGTALQAASVCGESEIPKLLIKEGADVNLQGGYYGTALQAASRFGRRKMVELLIEKGADVNLQGGEYGTALQAASACGESEIAKLLIKEGADVNLQGSYYGTALQAASVCGESEIPKLLIKEGADVNLQGCKYGNALQAASAYSAIEVVTLLLQNGADVNTAGGMYGGALDAALKRGNDDIAALLRRHGAIENIFR